MSKFLSFFILVTISVQLVSSNVVDLTHEKNSVIELNFESQNSIYKVSRNSKLSVLISGNETTGYRWFVDKGTKTEGVNFLNLDESNSTSDYEISQRNGKYVAGAGGQYNFKIEPTLSGNVSINFNYQRSWEPEPISFMNLKLQIN